jgi:pimeloyl-ACP methyl ester carboxylesterase
MKPSASAFHGINGMRYHVRSWGEPGHPKLFLFHGWMDVSASFQFLVDELKRDWHVIAPDWRGFGLTQWNQGTYWFPEYFADLDALLNVFSPDAPANLVGHSLGGNVACVYGGIRPQRVKSIISLEGFGVPRTEIAETAQQYAKWLNEVANPPQFRPYVSFDAVAERLKKNNPRLSDDRARFLARHWAKQESNEKIELLSDPKHKIANAMHYRIDEALVCWRAVTAPVLWVGGADSWIRDWLNESPEQFAERKQAFNIFSEATISDAGHMLHHDQPAEVARVLETFLHYAS